MKGLGCFIVTLLNCIISMLYGIPRGYCSGEGQRARQIHVPRSKAEMVGRNS